MWIADWKLHILDSLLTTPLHFVGGKWLEKTFCFFPVFQPLLPSIVLCCFRWVLWITFSCSSHPGMIYFWILLSCLLQLSLFWFLKHSLICFPGGASDKEPSCQCRRCRRPRFDPSVGKILWRREWQPTPVFLPEESHGQRSLVGYSPWCHKESDTTERLNNSSNNIENKISIL